uniref:Uncharacterized protein n=1 Tax=Dicentrarchus labrax TaxID=13489 RepID=A0A8P4K0Y1_DICLA
MLHCVHQLVTNCVCLLFGADNTSGGFLNDLLTPAVRFSPWVTPLLGPIAPMVSSDDCRGLTGIPVTQSTSASALLQAGDPTDKVLLSLLDLLLLNVSSREEKSHHPFEELVHQLDGERHHLAVTLRTKDDL